MSEFEMIECPTCATLVQSDLLIPAGASQICVHCRDEYLQRVKEGVSTDQSNEWVAIREEHIKHESSLRSIGLLYYLGGAVFLILGLTMTFGVLGAMDEAGGSGMGSIMVGMFIFYLIFALIFIAMGRGFRQLKRWVRIPGTILAVLGLLQIPIGTLINGYILYLMFSEKGKLIFSPEYQGIRAATPEVKYKSSALSWILLIVLLLGLFGLVGYFAAMGA